MPADRIEELADKVKTASCDPDEPRCSAGALLLPAILRLLAEGRPASVDKIGQAIGLPAHLAASIVSYVFPEAELDTDGRLVGLGLSLTPTPHEVLLGGRDRTLYAWCAPDALLLPTLMGENAHITSPCGATGKVVTIVMGQEGVEEVKPPSAVVSFVTEIDRHNLRASGCNNQHFFSSSEAAENWLADHPHAFTLPVANAFRLLTHLIGPVMGVRTQGTVDIGEVMARLTSGQHVDEILCRPIVKSGDRFTTKSGQPEPGDMWWDPDLAGRFDSEAHQARGGGPHLVVRLPNDLDWDIDGPMDNGPGWYRTGEPPNVTVVPSVVGWGYHGLLLKGKLIRIRETS